MRTFFVFITGGVVSGLGKGIVAASVGKILQARGYRVSMVKLDPYLNPDPGTMNPVEHGEIFVTEEVWEFSPYEGVCFKIAEIDEDFGHYERFLNRNMHPSNNVTSGQVMLQVILGEREGRYLGQTVRLIPHVVDEIKRRIYLSAEREGADFLIVELGGTVGDYEAEAFVEALRQIRNENPGRCVHIHVSYIPFLRTTGEHKTKPAQMFIRIASGAGIPPDAIVVRSEEFVSDSVIRKLSLYSGVPERAVFRSPDQKNVYMVPITLESEGLGRFIEERFRLSRRKPYLDDWVRTVSKFDSESRLRIGILSKYWRMKDVHISIIEALRHAAGELGYGLEVVKIDAVETSRLPEMDGLLVAPGFGRKGTENMIEASWRAFESGIPTLGICFGAQLMTVSFARNKMGWDGANSTELDPETPYPVVDLLPEQRGIKGLGGTMRLGSHEVVLVEGSVLRRAYGREVVRERFRHRYHIVRDYAEMMRNEGYVICATDVSGRIINAFEVEGHPFFVGVQFHPEYKSRPGRPNPTYMGFIRAVLEIKG